MKDEKWKVEDGRLKIMIHRFYIFPYLTLRCTSTDGVDFLIFT
jgi:hypothetical protein